MAGVIKHCGENIYPSVAKVLKHGEYSLTDRIAVGAYPSSFCVVAIAISNIDKCARGEFKLDLEVINVTAVCPYTDRCNSGTPLETPQMLIHIFKYFKCELGRFAPALMSIPESGGAKLDHGSGGIVPLRAA